MFRGSDVVQRGLLTPKQLRSTAAWRRLRQDDRRRLNRLVAAGWVVRHVTADDLRRPDALVARLRALRAARLAEINAR